MSPEPQAQELPQTSFAILGMLSFQPMSGYDLKLFADKSISHFYWSPAKSQIYAELRRLKNAGLVTEQHIEQENRPDKRVYAITDSGRTRLAEWIDSSDFEQDVFKSSVMLKVFFGGSTKPESLIRLLKQNMAFEKDLLANLHEMERKCMEAGDEYDALFSLITIRGGIHFTEASVKWSQESIKALEDRAAVVDGEEKGL